MSNLGSLEKYQSLTPNWFRNAQCALLVFDMSDIQTLDKLSYFVDQIEKYAADGCVMQLIGNKADLVIGQQIPTMRGRGFAALMGIPYLETSAKSGQNVTHAFEAIVKLSETYSMAIDKNRFYRQQLQIRTETIRLERELKKKKSCCNSN